MNGNEFPPLGGRPPGHGLAPGTSRSWSSIASLNISKRNKTNTLEIRLENEQGNSCSLELEDIERLLRRLKISSNHFTSLQACPERKNVVYITLCNGIDVNKFISNNNESFILKPGIRTTTMKHVSKREVNVQVFGLHPDTKDEAVIRYLNAHGMVNSKHPVTYGVYPGTSGSSLLAGKRNGNRIYSMEVKRNIGSVHIIDGEKVSIKYPGQTKTCNKCQQDAQTCPGKGLAKDCSSEKVLLSEHMLTYWKTINFQPETTDMNEVDVDENEKVEEVIQTKDQVKEKQQKMTLDKDMMNRYGGVVIKGFKKEVVIEEAVEILKDAGLPFDYGREDLQTREKGGNITIYVHDLKPEACVEIVNNLHGEEKLGQRISVFTLVEDTPTKAMGESIEHLIEEENTESTNAPSELVAEVSNVSNNLPAPITPIDPSSPTTNQGLFKNIVSDLSSRFWNNMVDSDTDEETTDDEELNNLREQFKRKAEASPDNDELSEFERILSKKEKKKLKKALNKSN